MAKTVTVKLRSSLVKIHSTRIRSKAPDYLRETIGRQERVPSDAVKIDTKVNEYIFRNVSRRFKPLKLSVDKIGGVVTVKLFEEKKPEAKPAANAAKPAAQAKAAPAQKQPAAKGQPPQQKPKADEKKTAAQPSAKPPEAPKS